MEVPRRFIPAFRSAFTFLSSSSPLKRLSTEADILPGEIGEISGVPDKHLRRKVVIYSPARTAMQQGSANTGIWKINFVSTEKWENPLMGWTSTGDPYASLDLCFDSREAAEHFAKKYGWEYTVREPHRPILKPKAYADNYKFKGNIGEEE